MAWEPIKSVGANATMWKSDTGKFAVQPNYLGRPIEPSCGEVNGTCTRKAAMEQWRNHQAQMREGAAK